MDSVIHLLQLHLQDLSVELQRRLDDANQTSNEQSAASLRRQEESEMHIRELQLQINESTSENRRQAAVLANKEGELNATLKQLMEQRQDWEAQQELLQVHLNHYHIPNGMMMYNMWSI